MAAKLLIPIFVVLVVASFAGGILLGSNMSSGASTNFSSICPGYGLLDKIKERGKLVVGTSADWPPYEYVTPSGEFAGIDIEIAKRIAQELGVKLEIKDLKFAALFEAVRRGDIDMAIADIAMKPERLQAVDFTIPYRCELEKSIIMRKADASSYQGYESLSGKKIGVQLGTTEQDLAEKYLGKSAEIVTYDRVYPEMVMALKAGHVDAIVVAPDVAELIVSKEKDLVVVGGLPIFTCSVIAIPHCAYDFKQKVSQVLWGLRQSGEFDNIVKSEIDKWMQLQG